MVSEPTDTGLDVVRDHAGDANSKSSWEAPWEPGEALGAAKWLWLYMSFFRFGVVHIESSPEANNIVWLVYYWSDVLIRITNLLMRLKGYFAD